MVQVDVFWSYGIGAGFAVANSRAIERLVEVETTTTHQSAFDHRSFRDALLYLGCLFVPSGAFLIWQFTSWETMHVAAREDIPGWLMTGFTITNFTQGILGFATAAFFLRRRQPYAAYLQWVLGHMAMLFILVYGWDGTGYKRFTSSNREEFLSWTWETARAWVTGDVATSLMLMGVFVLPGMFVPMARDLKRGYSDAGLHEKAKVSTPGLALSLFVTLLAGTLAIAIMAAVVMHYLGAAIGAPVALAIAYGVAFRRGGLWYRHFSRVI